MKPYKLVEFEEKLLKKVMESLVCMPMAVRYLLKFVETSVEETAEAVEEVRGRRAVVDFMFRVWWAPRVRQPSQYGLLKNHKSDENVAKNIENLMELLYSSFVQKLSSETPESSPTINDFSTEKK